MHLSDPLRRVLVIDLSKRAFEVVERPDLFEASIGGAGVAIRLLEERCPPGADPLGPENPIVFAVGPLVGLYPLASKTVAMFKSPHTGNLGESHAGGRSAVSIRMAGYGAVVITGRSPGPTYLVIEDGRVAFRDASALWGLRSSTTAGSVLREREGGSGHRSILRIGPAGEAEVSYACVITETYRHFGRLGLGAVFGSKRLKGIVIAGTRTLPVADPGAYRREYDALFRAATTSPAMRKYHDLGTPMNVLPLHESGALPTRNLRSTRFEAAEAISGEAMASRFLGRRLACSHCPVACIHLAALRTPHPKEPYFYKTSMLGYDYELIYALGSKREHGQVRDAKCRQPDQSVRRIVRRPTDLYRALARGVDHASSVYGGREFALALGGNEMPGYHTGPVCHLGFLTGSRHSHLDSAGYSLDQKPPADGRERTAEETVAALIAEEQWRQVLSSLVVCFFSRGLYAPDVVARALAPLGIAVTPADLDRVGAETLQRKWAFKRREGFDAARLRIPERVCETETPLGRVDADALRRALEHFAALSS